MNGERKKGKYKIKDTMYRIFGRDYQYRKEYGQKRDEVKCTHVYIYKIPLPCFKVGQRYKTSLLI
jgi:hypothetical protein